MKLRILAALSMVGALVSAPAQAQPTSPLPTPGAASAAAGLVAARPAFLHASTNDSFVQHNVITAKGGLQYVPYDRSYKGLPVLGGDFVIVTDSAGRVLSTSVAQEQTIELASLTPTVSRAKAESVARDQLSTVASVGDTHLMVFALGTPRLGWQSTVTGTNAEGASRLTVVVDALTGAVLDSQEHVLRGDGTSALNGPNPVHLDTLRSAFVYYLLDPTLSNDVSCQNAATNITYSGADDLWGNGVATDRETGCVDAMFAAQTERRMLAQWLGRNGFTGTNGGWPIRVGIDDRNAYFDGTQVQIGHNLAGGWVGSLDVTGHEFGHGIDYTTPSGYSRGGTIEFVADVFGTATEWYAAEPAQFDPPDYLVAERANFNGVGASRNMYRPSALGDPNCYSSSVPDIEQHAAAGPGNHWFYLTAMGSSPSNGQPASPTCDGAAVTGIGLQTALRIFYNAMLMKTTASSYPSYRTWTLTAAKNLTPGDCTNFATVKAAWDAVGVPAQPADPTCQIVVVPTVVWWNLNSAIDAVGSLGLLAQPVPGIVDCGPTTVRSQDPVGGTRVQRGSTVRLEYNQQPGGGQECP